MKPEESDNLVHWSRQRKFAGRITIVCAINAFAYFATLILMMAWMLSRPEEQDSFAKKIFLVYEQLLFPWMLLGLSMSAIASFVNFRSKRYVFLIVSLFCFGYMLNEVRLSLS